MDARQEIGYGLTDEELRECMLQIFADDDEHRRIEYPEWGTRSIERIVRQLLVNSEGTDVPWFLLQLLDLHDEHIRADHLLTEGVSDPPDAYIRSVVDRVRSRYQLPDES
jgi:hypothetical protein